MGCRDSKCEGKKDNQGQKPAMREEKCQISYLPPQALPGLSPFLMPTRSDMAANPTKTPSLVWNRAAKLDQQEARSAIFLGDRPEFGPTSGKMNVVRCLSAVKMDTLDRLLSYFDPCS